LRQATGLQFVKLISGTKHVDHSAED
jgi:hypothetical protein